MSDNIIDPEIAKMLETLPDMARVASLNATFGQKKAELDDLMGKAGMSLDRRPSFDMDNPLHLRIKALMLEMQDIFHQKDQIMEKVNGWPKGYEEKSSEEEEL